MNCLSRTLLAADDSSSEFPKDGFAAFPEFLVSDMADFLPCARSVISSSIAIKSVLEFVVRGMESANRISNKHLRGQLALVMSQLPITVSVIDGAN
jgi:hypothetical protein